MTFWEHIDEFRKRLFYPFVALIVFTIVAFILKDTIFGILLAANSPDFITYTIFAGSETIGKNGALVELINTDLPAQLIVHLKVSLYVGLIFTLPYLVYKLFKFASPGLYENERRYSAWILFFSFVSFFIGILVNYFVIFPFAFRFLSSYQVADQVVNMIAITSYLDTLLILSLLMGICFELPIVSLILSKLGVMTSKFLSTYRRHAIVAILIIAAVITPTTDVFTLMLVSGPIYLLYELSIIIVKIAERKRHIEST